MNFRIPFRNRVIAVSLEDSLYGIIVLGLCVLYVVPLWVAHYLPVLDMPVHQEMASIVHNFHEPAYGFAKFFEPRPGLLPYWTYYGTVSLLAHAMSIDAANRLVLTLLALGLVATMAYALKVFARSRWLVLLSFPLIYDVNATYGYVAFRMSVVLGLLAIALIKSELRAPRIWRSIAAGFVVAATYFTHAHGFAILGLLALLLFAAETPSLKRGLRVALGLLPAAIVALPWFVSAIFGSSPEHPHGTVHTLVLPLIRLLELVPHRLLNSFSGQQDEVVGLALLFIFCALVLASPRSQASAWRARLAGQLPEIFAGVLLLCYFAVPNQILSPTTQIYGINYRFLLPVALYCVLVPRLQLSGLRVLWLAPALVIAVYYGCFVLSSYQAFGERYRDFDTLVDKMQPAKRVMAYTYNTADPDYTIPMLGHFVGYYHARKGGAPSVGHTFATYSYMPMKLRDERAHPEPDYRENLPLEYFAAHYDYFLVTDTRGSRRVPFRDPQGLRLVAEAGIFRVYQKR